MYLSGNENVAGRYPWAPKNPLTRRKWNIHSERSIISFCARRTHSSRAIYLKQRLEVSIAIIIIIDFIFMLRMCAIDVEFYWLGRSTVFPNIQYPTYHISIIIISNKRLCAVFTVHQTNCQNNNMRLSKIESENEKWD